MTALMIKNMAAMIIEDDDKTTMILKASQERQLKTERSTIKIVIMIKVKVIVMLKVKMMVEVIVMVKLTINVKMMLKMIIW